MPAYISVTFEKDLLPNNGPVRIITRNRDDGGVPPQPNASYFPTQPDLYRQFIVGEYVSDTVGERFLRVATLAEMTSVPSQALIGLRDVSVDFVAAGTAPGDVINLFPPPDVWISGEYPTPTFTTVVSAVLNSTDILVALPFPDFRTNLPWSIPTRSLLSTSGTTRRSGFAVGPFLFRDSRFQTYYDDAATAERFVSAVKTQLTSLANAATGSGLVDESFTAVPS